MASGDCRFGSASTTRNHLSMNLLAGPLRLFTPRGE